MDNFVSTYINEAKDLLANLENVLLDLEKNKTDISLINEVFRVMHTLKGTSAMFGFENIGKVTHHMENIYDLARESKLNISENIISLTLKITDFIKEILEDPDNKNIDIRLDDLISEIIQIENETTKESTIKEKKQDQEKSEDTSSIKTYYIAFEPNEKILFRGINLLGIFKDLAELGNYRIVHHSYPLSKENEKTKKLSWGIYLASFCNIRDIEDVFLFVIDDCKILEMGSFNFFESKEITQLLENEKTNEAGTSGKITEIIKNMNSEEVIDEIVEDETKVQNSSVYYNNNTNDIKRVSVNSEKLDRLMNLVSELVTSNAMLNMAAKNEDMEMVRGIAEKFDRLSGQFRENALSIRLVSIKELLLRFKRLIRDLSKKMGKDVQFIIEGEETEMDKNIIDNLSEPMVHIFRNAIDHGIESPDVRNKKNKPVQGTIKLAAFYSGTYVYLTIQDDGAGINHEQVKKTAITKGLLEKGVEISKKEVYNLLFAPGFSTTKKVTGISGRGVGLDVVKNKISELHGEIEVDSEIDLGTTFTIKLQQTVSIIDALLIKSSDSLYLIPRSNIELCIEEEYEKLNKELNKRIIYQDEVIPFTSLRQVFHIKGDTPVKSKLVVVNKNNFKFAIAADSIIGEHQAVVKPLGKVLKDQEYFTGVSLLGDGKLAFMIDLFHIKEFMQSKNLANAV